MTLSFSELIEKLNSIFLVCDEYANPVGTLIGAISIDWRTGHKLAFEQGVYVLPEYRGKGLGKLLLTYLAKLAVDRGCGRFEWSVLDWNQPAIDFYQAQGAVLMHDWRINRVTGDKLNALAAQYQPD